MCTCAGREAGGSENEAAGGETEEEICMIGEVLKGEMLCTV